MRIQYASDLHLELWRKKTFDETLIPVAPYLVLCGDVAKLDDPNLHAFLEFVSERWKLAFWIPGNEEIWKSSDSESKSLQLMRNLCSSYRNIKILYMNTYLLEEDHEKLLVVGLPLWHKPRDDAMLHYERNIYIKPLPCPTDKKKFSEAHYVNIKFLEKIIKNAEYPILVCSYYPIFTWLYEEDWIQELTSAVLDRELENFISFPIIAWISGHNHLPIEHNRRYYTSVGYQGSVLFVSNPRGKKEQYYRREAVLNLKPSMLEGFQPKPKTILPEWVLKNRVR